MIIIAGSSPALGEWSETNAVTHGGLAEFLKDSGRDVINLGQPGEPDDVYFSVLHNFITYNPQIKVDKIIFFQSSWLDNFIKGKPLSTEHRNILQQGGLAQLTNFCMSQLYYKLSKLGVEHNIPIYLVGTLTDTIWLDQFTKEYPMVTVACQSFVNLVLNQNHKVDKPVYTLLHRTSTDIIKTLKGLTPDTQSIINAIDDFDDRMRVINACDDYFYPDKWHVNRHGHQRLFEFLTKHYQI